MNELEDLDRATAGVAGILDRVRDDQWERPTACSEWNVREVVNHLAHGALKAAAWVSGPTDLEPELAERALALWRAHLGDGPRPDGSPFAEAQQPPHDASAADRLAAFLGRRPVRS